MQYSLILPAKHHGANPEAILATAQTAERLGWRSVISDDHVLPPREGRGADYALIFEVITMLAWLGGQTTRIRLGTSVVVAPQRNVVVTAKELATLDVLTGGRVTAGVGIGWSEGEYRNLGSGDRYHVRGKYLDETIALWRHLWSGIDAPFTGRFHQIEDAVMAPLPVQGGALPIVVGGRSDHGVRRAGRLGDGYQLSQNAPDGMAARLPLLDAAAAEVGRPRPWISARVQVYFGDPPEKRTAAAMSGTVDDLRRAVDAWEAIGLDELAIDIDENDAEAGVRKLERFHDEVLAGRGSSSTAD
jgi:probable F420-dependent oxidoreductase